MTQFDAPHDELIAPPSRTSALAVTSLVLSIICCIPGLGAIGVLTGAGAVIGISKSDGRVKGMGIAVSGVVLGLIVTLAWIFITSSLATGFKSMGRYGEMVAAIENRDRASLTPWISFDADLTDEELTAFSEQLQAEYGVYVSSPSSIADLFSSFMTVGQSVNPANADAQSEGYQPIPFTAEFDSGVVLFVVGAHTSPPMAPNDMPRAQNVGFVAKDGTIVWLVDPDKGP